MKTMWPNAKLIRYEIHNIAGNIFTFIFGIIFPILMSCLISNVYLAEIPKEQRGLAITSIFITMSMVIPMAILLIGYAANYSQEIENEVPLRLRLFGFHEKTLLVAKMIAHLIYLTGAYAIYVVADVFLLDILVPRFSSVLILLVCLYLVAITMFMLSHAIATLVGKFGPTFAITMILYFGFMILCGMMGIRSNQLPGFLQSMARTLPMSYISTDFGDFWQGGSYNFVPLIQSYLFLGAVAGILLILSIKKNKRVVI